MLDASSEGRRQDFQELLFRRERPAFNPFYGRFVALIKIVLPTIATALIVLVAMWPHLDEQKKRFQIEIAQIDPRDAENLRMLKPLFNGVDDSRRPFSITANSADQTDAKSTLVELLAPEADVLLDDGTWVALTARKGVFDNEKQILELWGGVNLFHDKGYEFSTSSAIFDLAAGDAIGTEKVEGQGSFGRLQAEGFRLYNRGQNVEFTGKTKLLILPKKGDEK